MKSYLTIVAATLAFAAGSAQAANLITNGSFGTGDLTGWTVTGDQSATAVISPAGVDQTVDQYELSAGSIYSYGYFSQTFTDKPGQVYTASGWAGSDGYGGDWSFTIDGASFGAGGAVYQPYTHYVTTFTGTGSDTLTTSSINVPAYNHFDNFYVGIGGAPEPAAWATMMLGLGFAGATLRRRKARTA